MSRTPLTGLGHQPLWTRPKASKCLMTPALPHPSKLSFMSSEHSSYNLGCFSVLAIFPKETCDPRVTWNREEISGKGVSVDLRQQCARRAGAAYIPPLCLCGKSGNGLRVLGHGNPQGVGDQTFAGNPAGGNSEAESHPIFSAWTHDGACHNNLYVLDGLGHCCTGHTVSFWTCCWVDSFRNGVRPYVAGPHNDGPYTSTAHTDGVARCSRGHCCHRRS